MFDIMFFMETQLHDISWFCLTHHGRQSSNSCSELLKHEHTACHENCLSLCFLSLPLGHPPNPQLLAHDLVLVFFMTPFKKAQENTAAPTVLMKQLHFSSTSLRVPQSHSSNIVLIKQFLIFLIFLIPPLSEREKGTSWQAPSRDQDEQLGDWTVCHVHSHHLRLVSTATSWNFISNLSVQHSDQPATIEMQLVCFCGHFICQCGSRRTPEPTAEHLLRSHTRTSTSDLLLCHSSPFLDTLLKELPASHSLLQTTGFCVVVFMFFTPVTQTEHQWSTAGAHPAVVANTSVTAQQPWAPSPAQLHHSWWQCHSKPGTTIPV